MPSSSRPSCHVCSKSVVKVFSLPCKNVKQLHFKSTVISSSFRQPLVAQPHISSDTSSAVYSCTHRFYVEPGRTSKVVVVEYETRKS